MADIHSPLHHMPLSWLHRLRRPECGHAIFLQLPVTVRILIHILQYKTCGELAADLFLNGMGSRSVKSMGIQNNVGSGQS